MNSGETGYSQKSMQQQVLKDKELQKISCQSDQPIVSMKSCNGDGEKGLARTQWERRNTSTIHRDGQWVLTKLISITQRTQCILYPRLEDVSLGSRMPELGTFGSARGIK